MIPAREEPCRVADQADDAAAGPARRDETLPARYVLAPSPTGEAFAYWMDDDPRTLLTVARADPDGLAPIPRTIPVPEPLAGLAWMPDASGVLVYAVDDAGVGTLHLVDLAADSTITVAEGLDASSFGVRLAVSDDGRFAYLGLAGPAAPDPEARHRPDADRDLDIWDVDLASGERRPVVEAPGEQLVANFAAGTLYWVSIETRSEVALLPLPNGSTGPSSQSAWTAAPPRVVASGVQLPTWRPDGGALGMTTDDWRIADWALDLDAEGIRVTDFGWEVGSPDWAPDSRRLVMDSWDEGGGSSMWILELDPETGSFEGRTRVP